MGYVSAEREETASAIEPLTSPAPPDKSGVTRVEDFHDVNYPKTVPCNDEKEAHEESGAEAKPSILGPENEAAAGAQNGNYIYLLNHNTALFSFDELICFTLLELTQLKTRVSGHGAAFMCVKR
jgi:hypothetical protein